MNIIFNSLLAQLVKYDVHTTRNIKFIHVIIYHILLLYAYQCDTDDDDDDDVCLFQNIRLVNGECYIVSGSEHVSGVDSVGE